MPIGKCNKYHFMMNFFKNYLSCIDAFGRLNKAGIEQCYQPMRFEGCYGLAT
jgi:hypothetical protein